MSSEEYHACLKQLQVLLSPWRRYATKLDKRQWFEEQFVLALEDLDPQSTTGLGPLQYWGSTVGDALGRDTLTGEYKPEKVEMLKQMVWTRLCNPDDADPILVFVKPEPHKVAKIKEGRLRLISAVGIVDTMVDRVMFRWLQQSCLASVGRTPVMIGWSPYYGGYRLLTSKFRGRKSLAADKSSWDWTVKGWLLVLVKDLIKNLHVNAPPWWSDWVDRRWEILFRDAEFGFRDGTRVQQNGWGVMKSGCYLTLLINSVSQLALHHLAVSKMGVDPAWDLFHSMGDDTLQAEVEDMETYLDHLRSFGAIIKEWHVSDTVDFCGHTMKDYMVVPAYKNKHIFSVLHANSQVLPEILSAYQAAYSMDSKMWDWLAHGLCVVAPHRYLPRAETLTWIQG